MSFMRESLTFLYSLGLFDVILPFLLIFVLSFAVLERTKVLGTFKIGKDEYSKKNLDALAAFSLAFIVVGSAKIVSFIVSFASYMMLILVILSLLIILNASFYGYASDDEFKIEAVHKKIMFWLVLLSVIVILFLSINFSSLLQNPNVVLIKNAMSGIHIDEATLMNILYSAFSFGIIGFFLWLILKEPTVSSVKKDSSSHKKKN